MKVQTLVSVRLRGPADGDKPGKPYDAKPGVLDLPEDFAKRLIANGQAKPLASAEVAAEPVDAGPKVIKSGKDAGKDK